MARINAESQAWKDTNGPSEKDGDCANEER